MKLFQKPLFTGFAPNTDFFQIASALSFLIFPWKWKSWQQGEERKYAKKMLQEYFGSEDVHLFDSGRSALYIALKALGVGNGDEVIVPAYTCVVVINAIHFTGAQVIYCEIMDDLNIDPSSIEERITPKTKAVLVQHTFGVPAKIEAIQVIATKYKLKVVEDVAHAFGARYNGKLLGTFGDAAMFSFGSDKVLSSVRGGALRIKEKNVSEVVLELSKALPELKKTQIFQHLFHPIVFFLAKPFYNLEIGKIFLKIAKSFSLIAKIIYEPEKRGEQVAGFPAKYPNAFAALLIRQLQTVDSVNAHRDVIANVYGELLEKIARPLRDENGVFLDFPIFSRDSQKLAEEAKKQGILLGTYWFGSVIIPRDTDKRILNYAAGTCKVAERLSQKIILLPTGRHITKNDAKRISNLVSVFENNYE